MTAFKDWMKAAGFNGKQITVAAHAVGLSETAGKARARGVAKMNDLERRGLTAHLFGLPPFEAGIFDFLDEDARLAIDMARRQVDRCRNRMIAQTVEPEQKMAGE